MSKQESRKFIGKLVFSAIVFLLFVVTNMLYAQVTWDSTRRPAIYDSRVQFYKAFPKNKKDVVFLGNSITFWGDWSGLLENKRVRNYGIPGDNTYGVLERLDNIIQGHPEKIFIMIGINDIGRNTPDSVVIANGIKIMKRIRDGSPRTLVYYQSMLPTNPSFNKLKHLHHKNDRIQYINGELEKFSKSSGVTWVDLLPFFADENGNLKFEYTYDGVHLTFKGYEVWRNVLRSKGYIDFN